MTAPYPRHYKTAHGSTVTVPRWGVWEYEFDWLEEGACPDAAKRVAVDDDDDEPMLRWDCECCAAGSARLLRCYAPGYDDDATIYHDGE